jgi:diaminopimelate decarboxylase
VAEAGALITQVLYVKETAHKTFVIVDAGMNDLIRPALYDAHHEIVPVLNRNAPRKLVDVVGPVCESSDFLALSRELPQAQAGDLLAVKTAGAYGASMASSYNTRQLVPEILVRGPDFSVIRRKPDYDELWQLEQPAAWQSA